MGKKINRVELVWPEKCTADGTRRKSPRIHLPLQVIETVSPSCGASPAGMDRNRKTLSNAQCHKEADPIDPAWRNMLIRGDNLLVIGSLLEEFAGRIDLIYIDPPFATGVDYSFPAQIGEGGLEARTENWIEEKAYRDTWGQGIDSYLKMMSDRLSLMKDLLSSEGSIYVHLDTHIAPYIRLILDEILGEGAFRNEIYWYYPNKIPDKRKRLFTKSTDTILFYARGNNFFQHQEEERDVPIKVSRMRKEAGKKIYVRDETGKVEMIERTTRVVDNVWRLAMLHAHPEITGFPTQKPEALLERIIRASSREGGLIADFFCGSGTALTVAEKLSRRWIGCDLSRWGIHVTRKRLLGIEGCKPFEILSLGRQERRYWQGQTWGNEKAKDGRQPGHSEYIAFILRLYGAEPEPLAGMKRIHGNKGHAAVHVGAADAAVTADEIHACLKECRVAKHKELHVLGWEWETDVPKAAVKDAERRGVKLLLLRIPREVMEQQAVDRGDIRFFEVAHLAAEIQLQQNRKVMVILKDFAFPHQELIPSAVRNRIGKWSDYVDFWAVDWDYKGDSFVQGWVTYRTRKDRTLTLKSEAHVYEKPGKYTMMVKVIDIFGNDTFQSFKVKVLRAFEDKF